MKPITQTYIAGKMGVSIAFVNSLVNGKKRPSWKRAKQLAAITKTSPELWLDGTPDDIRQALTNQPPGHSGIHHAKKEAV